MVGEAGQVRPTKIKVVPLKKGELDDKKIPRQLIIKYGETHYILKAGLEWKATSLFGVGGYSLVLKMLNEPRVDKRILFKATMTILATGAKFVNYGEANTKNVNSRMISQMLHLAATRAECRVLRMATACGYASFDELRTINGNGQGKEEKRVVLKDGGRPVSATQLATIKSMGGTKKVKTKQEARDYLEELIKNPPKKPKKKRK